MDAYTVDVPIFAVECLVHFIVAHILPKLLDVQHVNAKFYITQLSLEPIFEDLDEFFTAGKKGLIHDDCLVDFYAS